MELKRAKETLRDLIADQTSNLLPEEKEAIGIGLEAVKYIENSRRFWDINHWQLLPGETERSKEDEGK